MARIERLEAALHAGSAPAPAAAAPPAPAPARSSAPAAPQPAPRAPQAASAVAVADSEPARSTATVALAEPTIEAFQAVWPAVLEAVRAENQLLGALLSEARPLELRDGEVVIAFSEHEAFKRKMADGRQNRTTVEEAIRSLAGSGLRVCFELRPLDEVAPGGVAAPPPSENELVARFVAEFDAEEIIPEPDVSNEEGGT
jgi:hypothetical protein